jgi:hypothetical protein
MSKSLLNTGLWTSSHKYGNSILHIKSLVHICREKIIFQTKIQKIINLMNNLNLKELSFEILIFETFFYQI